MGGYCSLHETLLNSDYYTMGKNLMNVLIRIKFSPILQNFTRQGSKFEDYYDFSETQLD